MGELQEKLDEIQEQSKNAYAEIMKVLEDNYCWKCPMRTTKSQSRCREVHAGRVLQEAMENGISCHLEELDIRKIELESIIIRMLKKKIKKQGGNQKENTIIFKVKSEQINNLTPFTCLKIKVNPRRVKNGEQILIPSETSNTPNLGSVNLITGFPFSIATVKRTFHEGSFWYVEVENQQKLPMESVYGVLLQIFKEGDSLSFD